jgi:hypothetical protein
MAGLPSTIRELNGRSIGIVSNQSGALLKRALDRKAGSRLGIDTIRTRAVGTQDAFNALHTDPQLANRFDPAILPRWTMGDEYLRLLASFESALPFEQPSILIEPTLALKILSLSEGTLGEMAGLIRRAAIHAIEHDGDRITGSVLDACGYIAPSQRRNRYAAI